MDTTESTNTNIFKIKYMLMCRFLWVVIYMGWKQNTGQVRIQVSYLSQFVDVLMEMAKKKYEACVERYKHIFIKMDGLLERER